MDEKRNHGKLQLRQVPQERMETERDIEREREREKETNEKREKKQTNVDVEKAITNAASACTCAAIDYTTAAN